MTMRESGFHEDLARAHAARRGSDKGFGAVFAVVFAVIAVAPLFSGGGVRLWSLAVAAVLLAVTILRPALLAPFNRLWTGFGLLLHRIVSPLVLALLFFVAVTPTGVLMRLSGKDPLRLRRKADGESYWIERRPPGPAPETIRNQF